jgi:hypothetical protein
MQALRDLVTTADGSTHDLGRWSWIGSFLAVLALTTFLCFKGSPPTITELAAALGAVAATHAASLFIKRQTEPKENP